MSFQRDCSDPCSKAFSGDLVNDVAWRNFLTNAREEGPWPLSDEHWQVVRFILRYYRGTMEAPALVRVARATRLTSKQLFRLFPFGPVRTIFQLAGLPLPADMIGCYPPLSRLDE